MPFRSIAGLILFLCSIVSYAEENEFSLNLSDVDIRVLIETVGDVTGKNFVVDPRVTGKVTVVTAKPMRASQVYDIFLSILKVHGFSAVSSGDIVKIVPNVGAKQDVSDQGIGSGDDALTTRIVPVHHVDAMDMVQILQPLMPQHAFMSGFPDSNVVILSDTAGNVNRLAKMIEQIDRDGNRNVEVINLKYASASELVQTLSTLIANRKPGKVGGYIPSLVADERSNSILLGGDPAARLEIRALIAHLDNPVEDDGNTEVIYLRYALAKDMVETLTGIKDADSNIGNQPRTQATTKKDVDIRADEATNALIITAPYDQMRSIKSVIRQLDIRRAQVHIEAIIAEVKHEKGQEIGVEWEAKQGNAQDGLFRASRLSSGSESNLTSAVDFIKNAGKGLNIGYFIADELSAVLRAFGSDKDINVLSTPSIVTLDNEEASIMVGQNIPLLTGSFTPNTTTGGGNPFQTVERQDVGIKLKVLPQINEGNSVKLKVTQEVSNNEPVPSQDGFIINKREIETSVLVDDGEILVLGGLIKDDVTETVEKVPLLGDIPLLGYLFQSTDTKVEKTNLMVFLRPQILRDTRRSNFLTHNKYQDIRRLQEQAGEDGPFLMPNERPPLLPEITAPDPEAAQTYPDGSDDGR